MARRKKPTTCELSILAIDQATMLGWATNKPMESGVENFSLSRGDSPGMRYLRFRKWLIRKVKQVQPDMVVYEQQHHRGGSSTEIASGLVAIIQKVCAQFDINHMKVHGATLKKHATGIGNASKEQMMDAYREKWKMEPVDDNEADARWMLDWAIHEMGS